MDAQQEATIEAIFADARDRYRVRGDVPLTPVVVGTDTAGQPLTHDQLFPFAPIIKLCLAGVNRLPSGHRHSSYEPRTDPQIQWASKAEHLSFDIPCHSRLCTICG